MSEAISFYLSPSGNDAWSGRLPEPNAAGDDGPWATLGHARDAVRALKQTGRLDGPVTVYLRGGVYPLREPATFTPEDSAPVTYAAYAGEQPALDGGRRIADWRVETRDGRPCWVAEIPDVAAGQWYFRQLFVNGQRRPRARLPKVGPEPERRQFYWMEDAPGLTGDFAVGSDTFRCAPGDMRAWRNLTDVEVVVLHYWVEERLPLASFDEQTRQVKLARRSVFRLSDEGRQRAAKYYVDNVFEALSEPGEWYLDRPTGRLYYLPLPGETPETVEVVAPCLTQLLRLEGDPESGQYVEFLRFEGLTFQHTEWCPSLVWGADTVERAPHLGASEHEVTFQAASNVPAAISLKGARYCAIEDCAIRHVGGYGVELAAGCLGNRIVGNEIGDLGAGGIKVNGADAFGPRAQRTGHNTITDNHVHHGGQVFHSAVGILLMHTFGNDVSHNHIHDFFYTGISCGWVWGYAENVARDNRIEKNHIHHLGFGWLSDMGGIYTLGVQPGTVIRGNVIHDVESAYYGGWAIYPDEGSAHIVIEDNLGYRVSDQPFHQHYGRENIVRNNIFALGGKSQVALSRVQPLVAPLAFRAEGHNSFTLERNIILTAGQPAIQGGGAADLRVDRIISDANLFWSVSGQPIVMCAGDPATGAPLLTWAEWQALGQDRHSVVADPKFRNVAEDDFTLADDSPALALGFRPLHTADVGPRPRSR